MLLAGAPTLPHSRHLAPFGSCAGYIPHLTYSSHWIPDAAFRQMVDRFLQQERAEIAYTLQMLRQQASPYKDPTP